jgi:hypothetical protein
MISPRLLLSLAALSFVACSPAAAPKPPSGTPSGTPATAKTPAVTGGAQLQFTELQYDFGVVPDTETLLHQFRFSNTGDAALNITNTKASCGCTVPTLEKTVFAPGEGSQIAVSWVPKGVGNQSQTVKITSNSVRGGLIVLTVRAVVEPFLKLNPLTVAFGAVPQSIHATRIINIDCDSKDLIIDSVTATHIAVTAKLLAPPVNGHARLEVTLNPGAPWGMFFPKVKITAREGPNGKPSVREVAVSANPYHDLRFDPPSFAVGRVPLNRPILKELIVTRPGGGPFTVVEASVVGSPVPDMHVTIEPQPDGSTVKLVLRSQGWNTQTPLSRTSVRVTTDVPGDQSRMVPVFGVVGPPVK